MKSLIRIGLVVKEKKMFKEKVNAPTNTLRTQAHDIRSAGLWPVELKKHKENHLGCILVYTVTSSKLPNSVSMEKRRSDSSFWWR